jgi:hypothetical protein
MDDRTLVGLPPGLRPSLSAEERLFAAVVGASLALHLAFVIYLRGVDWPRVPALDTVPQAFVQRVVVRPAPRPESGAAPAARPATARSPSVTRPTPTRTPTAGDRRARLREEVRAAVLRRLGALGEGPGLVADLLRDGAVDEAQEEALRGVAGLQTAEAPALRGLARRSEDGRLVRPADLRGGGAVAAGGAVDVGGERRVAPRVLVEPPFDGEGGEPGVMARLAAELRQRLSAIRVCYERALKRNPQVHGKLVMRLRLAPVGSVTAVDVEVDTVNDAALLACVRPLVLHWRFQPPGAPVELSVPVVFQPAQ